MSMTTRNAMLAKVHMAKKALCLSDADYVHVLRHNFNVESSKDLNEYQLDDLLQLFQEKGWKPKYKGQAPTLKRDIKPPVSQDRQPLMDKIEALLCEKGRLTGRRVSWKYAEAILKRQGGPETLRWATLKQLQGVVQALHYALKRDQARAAQR